MKKLMILVMAVTTMMFVGCSKVSKFEKLARESAAMSEKAGGKKVSEEMIQKEVEKFKKLSSEEQDKTLKAMEAMIDMAKTQLKK